MILLAQIEKFIYDYVQKSRLLSCSATIALIADVTPVCSLVMNVNTSMNLSTVFVSSVATRVM